ncbi:MAG: PfkB family carbohydrate kinase [Amaricoccus sp.]
MKTVVCCGAATLDTLFRVKALPTGPGKLLPEVMLEVAHGMATSAATAVARLGGRAVLFSRVGADAAGERFVAEIEAAGVDCRHVRRVTGARTPVATVLLDGEGERLIVPWYDPALGSDPGWLPIDEVARADAVLTDVRWPEGAAAVLDAARAVGIPAVLDADVGPSDLVTGLAARASHAVFSEPAALAVTGTRDVAAAVMALAGRLDGFVAVTAGPLGCAWWEGGRVEWLAPPAVETVDTLAAGDVFHGAFALALAEGAGIRDAIGFANTAAALKCRRFGGRLGAPDRTEVEAALAAGVRGAYTGAGEEPDDERTGIPPQRQAGA